MAHSFSPEWWAKFRLLTAKDYGLISAEDARRALEVEQGEAAGATNAGSSIEPPPAELLDTSHHDRRLAEKLRPSTSRLVSPTRRGRNLMNRATTCAVTGAWVKSGVASRGGIVLGQDGRLWCL